MSQSLNISHFSTGYCTAHERIAIRSGKWKEIPFHATCSLIEHPSLGPIVFDTGYTERFYEVTARFPNRIYAYVTPTTTQPEWSLKSQLEARGIKAEEVPYVIISHFHADHIAGLKDFPYSNILCSKAAFDYTLARKGMAAVQKGILPELLPEDLSERVEFIEDQPKTQREDALEAHIDYFGDGSLKFVLLPGHAHGQIGVLVGEESDQPELLAGDAYWLTESLEKNILPAGITGLLIDSWLDYVDTFHRLRTFRKQYPHITMTSCHCPSTFAEKIQNRHLF